MIYSVIKINNTDNSWEYYFDQISNHNLNEVYRSKNVVLSTAHSCKFPEAINKAINIKSKLPKKFDYILNEKENFDLIQNNVEEVKKYIINKLN